MARSRATMSPRSGVCTRPTESTPSLARGPAAEQGVEARHVHAVEPVGALTRERRLGKRAVFGIGLERAELPAHGLGAQIADEKAIDRAAIAKKVEHLVDEKLALAIGVARVHDARRMAKQPPDDAKSSGDETSSFQSLGVMGRLSSRQVLYSPYASGGAMSQDVPGAPRDHVAAPHSMCEARVAAAPGSASAMARARLGFSAMNRRMAGKPVPSRPRA